MPESEPSKLSKLGGRLSPRVRRTLSWLVAPILAVVAITVQISLDVPKGEMELRKPKAKKKRKSAASRTKPAAKSKSRPTKAQRWTPRSAEELEALRAEWSDKPFEDEPSELQFRRRHEAALRSVATRTRGTLLAGDKLVALQIRPACRSIRCTLELCGPGDLLETIAATLPDITVKDRPLWHAIEEIEPTPKRASRPDQICQRWLVDFAIQAPKTTELVIPIPTPHDKKKTGRLSHPQP